MNKTWVHSNRTHVHFIFCPLISNDTAPTTDWMNGWNRRGIREAPAGYRLPVPWCLCRSGLRYPIGMHTHGKDFLKVFWDDQLFQIVVAERGLRESEQFSNWFVLLERIYLKNPRAATNKCSRLPSYTCQFVVCCRCFYQRCTSPPRPYRYTNHDGYLHSCDRWSEGENSWYVPEVHEILARGIQGVFNSIFEHEKTLLAP